MSITITDLIPGLRDRGKHSPDTVIGRLRDENRRLLTIVAGADDAFAFLRQQAGEAEELVVQLQADVNELTGERDRLAAENARLRAELANRDAVTVPPMERDTSNGADQATAPIDVRPLREAADAGLLSPVIRISAKGASADPGLPPAA